MTEQTDYEDPEIVEQWKADMTDSVETYLDSQDIRLISKPNIRWHVAPHVGLWSAPHETPSADAIWIICGDLPTDWIAANLNAESRTVMRSFVTRFNEVANYMLEGKIHPSIRIGDVKDKAQQRMMGELLQNRAILLQEWIDILEIW